jgi:triacylglycerol lipase
MSDSKNPVVLVHGILDTISVFDRMTDYLAKLGWSVHRFDLIPNFGIEKLDTLALQVDKYINRNFSPEQKIDLIGFSMGGLITRYYLQRLKGIERVQRYINISAPNHGTLTAHSLSLLPGVQQMRPDSPWIENLNQDYQETLGKINTTVIWTPYDLMIVPPSSSSLPPCEDIQIPVLLHGWMVNDINVLQTISSVLSRPVKSNES